MDNSRKWASVTAMVGAFSAINDQLEILFPEFEEKEEYRQYTHDFTRILMATYARQLRGGWDARDARDDISAELKLGLTAVQARLKALRDLNMIHSIVAPTAVDKRKRLLEVTPHIMDRFDRMADYMLAAVGFLSTEATKRAGQAIPSRHPEGIRDPFPNNPFLPAKKSDLEERNVPAPPPVSPFENKEHENA